ncbi:PucR family transcriptional regulator [Sporolactobacillus sp. THM19-2]|nr:PucR family transcriptional regulator [Sporolactobacillus sp. THM19-2]
MKVSDLFHYPAFSDFRLLAGKDGTGREIRNVNMMDAPDIIDYLKPDDWLITTGYHLQDNPEFFCRLVARMAEKSCAALGIKTRRFIHGVPAEVIRLADRLSFPLIDLPNSLALVDIANQTLSTILDARTKELQFAIDTHQQFTKHIMRGEGIDRLLKRLAELIGAPVILLDSWSKVITSSGAASEPDFLSRLGKMGQVFFQMKSRVTSFSFIATRETCSLFTLYTYKRKRFFLLIRRWVPSTERLITLTIEQASNVIAFELMKDEALKQTDRKVRDAFFANLVSRSFATAEEAEGRAKEFGLHQGRPCVCAAAELDMDQTPISFTHFQMETGEEFEYLEGEVGHLPFPGHLFVRDHTCILIIELMMNGEHAMRFLKPALAHMQEQVARFFPHTLSFGLSNIFDEVAGIPEAFQEAVDALHAGMQMGRSAFIQNYQSRGIADLLRRLPEEDLAKLYEETLQSLAFPKREEDRDLLHTLYVYLESNCQISETAKKLFVHRNTVIYRMDKCEHLLGKDLKDPDTVFQLRFALRLKPLLGSRR